MARPICALVAYDGSDFAGFQFQPGQMTVQGVLERALERVSGDFCRVTGSGRTDRGVHASGQVISVDLPWRHPLQELQRAWNHYLPDGVLVGAIRERPEGFHPRFSASRRTYRYSLYTPGKDSATFRRHPLLDRFALVLDRRLDLSAMNRGCELLIGKHDFSTFGRPPQGENTVREIFECGWQQRAVLDSSPMICRLNRLEFVITGNAFLQRMVRNIVGSMLLVGQGKWSLTDLQAALQAQSREHSAPPVAPHGLILERVEYDQFPDLFQREATPSNAG